MRLEPSLWNVQLAEALSNMPNKIDECFNGLRSSRRKGFIPYICAGDPDLDSSVALALALAEAGADILELGLPFSDPLADGLVNQLAAQRALAAGATIRGVLDCVRHIRSRSSIPIVLYTYLNPILQFGWAGFHQAASDAGVDGLLILDLPPEEEIDATPDAPLHIRLVSPTTSPSRLTRIAAKAAGFIYYVSREGVTGVQRDVAASLSTQLARIRAASDLPIAVGFGISTPRQAKEVAQHADAVVVGSAIVDLIARHGRDAVPQVSVFAREIVQAIK